MTRMLDFTPCAHSRSRFVRSGGRIIADFSRRETVGGCRDWITCRCEITDRVPDPVARHRDSMLGARIPSLAIPPRWPELALHSPLLQSRPRDAARDLEENAIASRNDAIASLARAFACLAPALGSQEDAIRLLEPPRDSAARPHVSLAARAPRPLRRTPPPAMNAADIRELFPGLKDTESRSKARPCRTRRGRGSRRPSARSSTGSYRRTPRPVRRSGCGRPAGVTTNCRASLQMGHPGGC
jgi:hypothetical protein